MRPHPPVPLVSQSRYDMPIDAKTRYYNVKGWDFLTKARNYLAEGDLLQASEKGWGAAAEVVGASPKPGDGPTMAITNCCVRSTASWTRPETGIYGPPSGWRAPCTPTTTRAGCLARMSRTISNRSGVCCPSWKPSPPSRRLPGVPAHDLSSSPVRHRQVAKNAEAHPRTGPAPNLHLAWV